VEAVSEREDIFKLFGRFRYGFDFGAPTTIPKTLVGRPTWPFRNTHYVLENDVEPRFVRVDSATLYDETTGYGWNDDALRESVGIGLTPYEEIRSISATPAHLPRNVLFRDYISGEGPQVFRVKTDPGEYTVIFLHPDHTDATIKLHTDGDSLLIPFPHGKWSVSGLIIQGGVSKSAFMREKSIKAESRPRFTHLPPKTATAGQALKLSMQMSPRGDVTAVRLYYRPVNQLAKFKVLEAASDHASFTIPGEDISSKWDLMYYFEVLNKQNGGWFIPDPAMATPYYVVRVEPSTSQYGKVQ
jgi:hypothetical protein